MHRPLIFLYAFFLCFFSCKDAPKNESITDAVEEKAEPVAGECYMSVSGNDSILMQIVVEKTSVVGQLHYRFHEKDKSGGTIFGAMRGDTLIADYKFSSEGMESEREVAFIKRGNELVEGIGNLEDREGRMVFKSRSGIEFRGTPLQKTDCNLLSRYLNKK